MPKQVAFVTGASRGIGKAIAVDLAASGYAVAITARTVEPGEQREHSSTLARRDDSPLPGSLSETASLIRGAGGEALAVPADLLDEASLGAAATVVLERWGGVDVLVHNGRYIGPGHMDRFMETPVDLLRRQMEANVMAPLILNKLLLPSMIEKGGGSIVNITSASGYGDPTEPAGQGGWGMGYGLSKGAFQRVAGFLDVELRDRGIRAYNVQPGLIATERIGQDMARFGIANVGAPAEVVAKVVTWLLTDPEGPTFSGRNIEAQWFCHDRRLLDGWAGPRPNENHIRYDESAANLTAYEARWSAS